MISPSVKFCLLFKNCRDCKLNLHWSHLYIITWS